MKIRFDEDLIFWIIVVAVSLPIGAAFLYAYVPTVIDAFRHPSENPLVYNWLMGRIALLVVIGGIVIISLVRWKRKSDDDSD